MLTGKYGFFTAFGPGMDLHFLASPGNRHHLMAGFNLLSRDLTFKCRRQRLHSSLQPERRRGALPCRVAFGGRIQLALVEHVTRTAVRDYRKIKPLDQLREVRLNIRPEPRSPHIDMKASGVARQFQA